MCRRELDKAESEIKKNSSIIGDYKQVGPRTGGLGCAPLHPRASGLTSPFTPGQLWSKGTSGDLSHVGRAPGRVSAQHARRHLVSEATLCSPGVFQVQAVPYVHVRLHGAAMVAIECGANGPPGPR